MAIPYEKLVEEDLNVGAGAVTVTMPAGGTATGHKIGLHTFTREFVVTDYGALGDGVADDTASIQATLDAAAAAGGGVVFVPKGTYRVATATIGATILTLNSTKIHLRGAGPGASILQVAPSCAAYTGLLGPRITSTDLSYLEVDHLTFDHNISANALASGASIAANPQYSVYVFAGTDIRLHHLEILNASSINNLVVNGVACARVFITDNICRGIGDDPNHVAHDTSVIYTNADTVLIADNLIISTGQDAPGATTAIETHGARTAVRGNLVVNFEIGMNITGVALVDSTDLVIANNILSGVNFGIQIWSQTYSTHTTGYGIDGLTVIGNEIRLSGSAAWATKNVGHAEAGIFFEPNGTLDVQNVLIADNVITHPLEAVAVTNNSSSFAIGWFSVNARTLSHCRIVNNIVTNFPLAGIRLSCALENVEVAGNTLTNCGSTLDQAFAGTLAYRIPLFIGSETLHHVTIRDNAFRDTLTEATWRPAYFIYLLQTSSTAASFVSLLDNVFASTGSAMTSPITMDNVGGALQPYLQGIFPGFVPTAGATQKWKKGSRALDPTTGIPWAIGPDQFTWVSGLLATVPAKLTRLTMQGTPLVAGDFVLSGWGAGASIACSGSDAMFIIIVTAGSGPTLNPTITLTFKDGAWPVIPLVLANFIGGTGIVTPAFVQCATLVGSVVVQLLSTPVNGLTYQFNVLVLGKAS